MCDVNSLGLLMQYDVYGDLLGLLGAHPVSPLVSLHHLDVVQPIFPRMTRVRALRHLMESVNQDSGSIMQQSICYDKQNFWSISVSWGYVVQILRGVLSPRELEMPSRTFLNWYKRADYTAYAFNTRPVAKHPCQKPFVYYMTNTHYDSTTKQVVGVYSRDKSKSPFCRWRMNSPEKITSVVVTKKPDPLRWKKVKMLLNSLFHTHTNTYTNITYYEMALYTCLLRHSSACFKQEKRKKPFMFLHYRLSLNKIDLIDSR